MGDIYLPFADLPNQSGRNIVITGANRGIGLEAVKKFLAAGAHVIIGKNLKTGSCVFFSYSGGLELI